MFFFILCGLNYADVSAQGFAGQWRGSYHESNATDKSVAYTADYVLDLKGNGNTLTGNSYTYYTENGKKYYSICVVTAVINKQAKTIRVTEVKRIKTNENDDAGLQVHMLQYSSSADEEFLAGTWQMAKDKNGKSYFGATELKKKRLTKMLPQMAALSKVEKNKEAKSLASARVNNKTVEKTKGADLAMVEKIPAINDFNKKTTDIAIPGEIHDAVADEKIRVVNFLSTRKNSLVQTINTQNKTLKIEIYDNGQVDGDSISLFFNQTLLLSRARLTDKPIALFITTSDNPSSNNELVMYAENLGTIPPNTALMVVTDGTKRYEVRLTSDLKTNGSVKFIPVFNP